MEWFHVLWVNAELFVSNEIRMFSKMTLDRKSVV